MKKKYWNVFGYWIYLSRPKLKTWCGKDMPFILQVRLRHPHGDKVWFHLWGPDFMVWSEEQLVLLRKGK